MFDNIVYLNMDNAIDRREWVEGQFKEHNVTATRFSAIHDDFDKYCHDWRELKISDPQVGCLLSHLEIIRTYGDRDLLVFEDDINLEPMHNWKFTFQELVDFLPNEIDILQLVKFPQLKPTSAIKWHEGMFSTAAYFIRKEYVKRLVDIAFHDGKWQVKKLKSFYVQPLADSVLYSNGEAYTVTILSLGQFKSQIVYVGADDLGPGGMISELLRPSYITLRTVFP